MSTVGLRAENQSVARSLAILLGAVSIFALGVTMKVLTTTGCMTQHCDRATAS